MLDENLSKEGAISGMFLFCGVTEPNIIIPGMFARGCEAPARGLRPSGRPTCVSKVDKVDVELEAPIHRAINFMAAYSRYWMRG
jgi:hypothetical protein